MRHETGYRMHEWKSVVASLCVAALSGCASAPDASEEVARQVALRNANPADPDIVAMRPFLGIWNLDVETTIARASHLSEEERTRMRNQFLSSDLELEITRDKFISRSWQKTMTDRYEILDVTTPQLVIIRLAPADGRGDAPGAVRKLRLRDNQLTLDTERMRFIWNRAPAATP